jgi:ABC-type transport system substrate-binding protein
MKTTALTIWGILLTWSLGWGIAIAAPPSRVYCLAGDPASFNPQLATEEATVLASRPLYDQLVELRRSGDGQSTSLEPALADSWDVSRDGRIYTFHLRHRVHFHQTPFFTPTRNFDADDVLFSFNRQRLSAHPFHIVGGGVYPDFAALGLQKNVDEVEKLGKYRVRFTLIHPDPSFLSKLARDSASILSAEYGEVLLSKGTAWEIDNHPIGTGPYRLEAYERGKEIRYAANPAYFRANVAVDSLRFPILPSAPARDEKVRGGECVDPNRFQFP